MFGPPRSTTLAGLLAAAAFLLPAASRLLADDDISQREEQAIKSAVERVAPSVVRIETFGGLERIGDARAGNLMLVGTGPTTGLVVSADGYIASSAFNFVQKPAQILVHLDDGSRLPATLVATDHSRMIVLLKVSLPAGKELPVPVAAPEGEISVGQWSIAIGRTYESSKPSVSVGIISAVRRIWGKAIQTDAKISPNNYGGPLVDIQGRVMGVLVPLSPMATDELAGVEWYDSGIGFAVPLESINAVLPRLKKGEDLYGGLMGVSMKGIDIYADEPELAAVQPNSPAYRVGMKAKDKIVEIDGHKVSRQTELKHLLGPHYAGDKVKLVVLRGQERLEKTIELVGKLIPYENPFLGALPMRLASEPGVTLRYVYPDSPAAKAGLKPGDRITAWEGKPIKSLDELFEQLASMTPKQKAKFEIRRGDETLKLDATLASLPEAVPGELPPAHDEPAAAEGEKPATGVVKIKIPESQSECIAYVPDNYNARLSYGVVVWLHPPGGYKEDELVARWKDLCAKHEFILLAPKSADPAKWQRTELEFVRKTLDQLASKYHVDRAERSPWARKGAAEWRTCSRWGIASWSTAWPRSAPGYLLEPKSRPTIRCFAWRFTSANRARIHLSRRSTRRWPNCAKQSTRSRSKISAGRPARCPAPNSKNSPAGSTRSIASEPTCCHGIWQRSGTAHLSTNPYFGFL